MFDHSKGYNALHQKIESSYKEFTGSDIVLHNKILGFQFEIQSATKDRIPGQMENIHGLCCINLEHSIHAIKQLEYGNYHVFANIVRPIFESIPKMFYLLRHPKYIEYLTFKEGFDIWKTGQESKDTELLVDKYLFEKTGKEIDDNAKFAGISYGEAKRLIADRKKFTPAWYRRQIYTPKSQSKRNQTYGALSISSHANFVKGYGTLPTDFQAQCIKILVELSFLNLLLDANAITQALIDIDEFNDTKRFIMKTHDALDGFRVGSALYPDITTYTSNLNIKLPSK